MAVGRIDNDSDWQQMEEEITCPICGGIFKDPKTIPSCLHTFCKECLQESIKASKETANIACCPLCRNVLPATQSTYPTDTRIERLIVIFNRQRLERGLETKGLPVEPVRGCKKCEEDLPVVSWCVECQVSLCRGCDQIHSKWKEFRHHTAVTIEEYLRRPKDFTIKQQSR